MNFKEITIMTLGCFILSFGMYNIHSYVGVAEGGILGLILLLEYWLKISPSISGIILNGLCYLLGLKILGKKFLINSIIASLLFSLFYCICEQFDPIWKDLANYPFLAAVLGSLFVGIGVGLCIIYEGAPTGDDAFALSLSHHIKCDIRWIYLISDVTVLILSLTYIHDITKILSSLLTVVLSGQIIGLIQKMHNKKITLSQDR